MVKPKKRPSPTMLQVAEELFRFVSVSSMTECTGLIPAAPVSEPEIDSYSAIYDIPLSSDEEAAQHGLQNEKQKNGQGHSHPNTGR